MKGFSILVVSMTAAMVLSGCTSGEASPKAAATSAPPPTVSADSGSITGSVTDDELRPIPGADVAISGPAEAVAKTDDEGRFTFNELAPGEYTVIAQKLGYAAAAKKVTVEAAKAAEAAMVIASIAIDGQPHRYYEHIYRFIDGDAYTFAVGVYSPRSFTVNVTKGAGAFVTSMAWESTAPYFVRYMRVSPTYDGNSNTTKGRSPQTASLDELEVEKAKDKITVAFKPDFACGVDALCFVNNPDALIPQIASQQKINFYNTVFYNEAIPEGYTGLP